jgi:predicted enzyme related to lactoylglutathione lyase
MKKSPVVHFEMPAKDNTRVSKFYMDAFGWEMIQTGPEMGNYLVAHTAETDENQMVKTPGTINGGFFKYQDTPGMNIPHVIIQVEDLKEAMDAVKTSGGSVNGDPTEISGIGTYVSITDTEGNIVGVLQPQARE